MSQDQSQAYHLSQNNWQPVSSQGVVSTQFETEFEKFLSKDQNSTQKGPASPPPPELPGNLVLAEHSYSQGCDGEMSDPPTGTCSPMDIELSDEGSDDIQVIPETQQEDDIQVIPETQPTSQPEPEDLFHPNFFELDDDQLPDLVPEDNDPLKQLRHTYRDHWNGQVKKWDQLDQELDLWGKVVKDVESQGVGLVESIQQYLDIEYDIKYTIQEIIEKVARELVCNPVYTKYYQKPLDQPTVNTNMVQSMQKKKNRLIMDMYLPALATALDVVIKVTNKVQQYISVLTTKPIHITKESECEKKVMLLFDEETDKYKMIISKKHIPMEVELDSSNLSQTPPSQSLVSVPGMSTLQPPPPPGFPARKPDKLVKKYIEIFNPQYTNSEPTPSSSQNTDQSVPITPMTGILKGKRKSLDSESPNNPKKVRFSLESDQPISIDLTDSDSEDESSIQHSQVCEFDSLVIRSNQVIDELRDNANKSTPPLPTMKSPLKPISKGKPFSLDPYRDIVPEVVDKLPYNIDGLKLFMIDCKDCEGYSWQKKYQDGRYFLLNTSQRKGFRGTRRIGTCQGNFQCVNQDCPIGLEKGNPNQHQFKSVGRIKFCFSCDTVAERKTCCAVKCIEYSHYNKLLTVYHSGTHTCTLKVNRYEHDDFIEESLKSTGAAVGPRELAKIKMTQELQKQKQTGKTDMLAIVDIASQLTDSKRISDIKKKLKIDFKNQLHSLSAVGELKTTTDTKDKFLIYKINDSNMNANPSFVFKFSKKMAQIAIEMDIDNSANEMQKEPVYFDGMHSRCKGWKTLTTWVYHPSSRRLLRLATMEVKSENTEYVSLFWNLFNQVLSSIKGENYKFNPVAFITDEGGANLNGIIAEFGIEVSSKCYTCMFHFKQCLKNLIGKIPGELEEIKNEVQELGVQLITVTNLTDYHEVKSKLTNIGAVVPCVANWINWWNARRYHIFPVFRGYNICSVNMAEIGHSTLKPNKPLMLVDAAWEDTCSIILQEEELEKFLSGTGFSYGKGPSSTKKNSKEKREQLSRAKDYKDMFKRGGLCVVEGQKENIFIPSEKAKHKAPSKYSQKNPLQGSTIEQTWTPSSQASTSSLGTPSNSSESLFTLQTVELSNIPFVSQPSGTAQAICPVENEQNCTSFVNPFRVNEDNPPLLCFLDGYNISVCHGCKKKFDLKLRNVPKNLICKMLVLRDRLVNGSWVPGWRKSWGYYHLSLECLRKGRTTIEAGDIYIPNDVLQKLTEEHVDMLKSKGWWHCMRRRVPASAI